MIVYFDLETGGIEPQHPTIELAAVAMDGVTEVSAFQQCIAFIEADADPEALKMNHYDADRWKDAMRPPVAASRFAAWLRPYSDVTRTSKAGKPYTVARAAGYNVVAFDGPRLRAMFGTQFMPIDYHMRDVLQRVLFYFDEYPWEAKPENFKLSTVAAFFGIPTDGAHGALADARMCARLHGKLVELVHGY